jgi:hypothetical protein
MTKATEINLTDLAGHLEDGLKDVLNGSPVISSAKDPKTGQNIVRVQLNIAGSDVPWNVELDETDQKRPAHVVAPFIIAVVLDTPERSEPRKNNLYAFPVAS